MENNAYKVLGIDDMASDFDTHPELSPAYREAVKKADENVQATNGDAEAYVIPCEYAEVIKSRVGKTYAAPGKNFTIVKWVGQNFVVEIENDYHILPAMYVNQLINKGQIKEI